MTRNYDNYCSTQVNCRYSDRNWDWRDNKDSDWGVLTDFIKNGCDKNALSVENYKRICDKGYISDDTVQVMYRQDSDPNGFVQNFFKERFTVSQEILDFGEEISNKEYELKKDKYPKHIQPFIKLFCTNSLSNGTQIVYVIEEMLKRGILAPLTDVQKKAVLSVLIYM